MREIHEAIWRKFRVQKNDTYPYTGWAGTRATLAELFNDLGYKRGVEIGVQRGLYSETLCRAIPGLQLTSIDPWLPFHAVSEAKQRRVHAEAVERLTPLGVDIRVATSMSVVDEFADGSLDFCYIDGRHEFDWVMQDLIRWTPKVRVGGIVAGHDYLACHLCNVVPAVDAYTRAHNVEKVYVIAERTPTFFWVREDGQL